MFDRNLTSVWALQQHGRVSPLETLPQSPSAFPPSPGGAGRRAEAFLQRLSLHPPQQLADCVPGGHPEEEDQQCVQHLSGGLALLGREQRGGVLFKSFPGENPLGSCLREVREQNILTGIPFGIKASLVLFTVYKWLHLLVMEYLFPGS